MSDELLEIVQDRRNGRLMLRLNGEIDLSNADRLRGRIELMTAGSELVALDLSGIAYIDSQGLRLFTGVAQSLSERGAKLQLVAPPGSFARGILDLTGIGGDIEVCDRLES